MSSPGGLSSDGFYRFLVLLVVGLAILLVLLLSTSPVWGQACPPHGRGCDHLDNRCDTVDEG